MTEPHESPYICCNTRDVHWVSVATFLENITSSSKVGDAFTQQWSVGQREEVVST